jgi:hypothetical protein
MLDSLKDPATGQYKTWVIVGVGGGIALLAFLLFGRNQAGGVVANGQSSDLTPELQQLNDALAQLAGNSGSSGSGSAGGGSSSGTYGLDPTGLTTPPPATSGTTTPPPATSGTTTPPPYGTIPTAAEAHNPLWGVVSGLGAKDLQARLVAGGTQVWTAPGVTAPASGVSAAQAAQVALGEAGLTNAQPTYYDPTTGQRFTESAAVAAGVTRTPQTSAPRTNPTNLNSARATPLNTAYAATPTRDVSYYSPQHQVTVSEPTSGGKKIDYGSAKPVSGSTSGGKKIDYGSAKPVSGPTLGGKRLV